MSIRYKIFFTLASSLLLIFVLAGVGRAQSAAQGANDCAPATSSEPPQEDSAAEDSSGQKPEKAGRLFGVLPNYATVEKSQDAPPLTAKMRFRMAADNSFDPYLYPFIGVVTAISSQRAGSFGVKYATALADNTIGNFMTTAVAPTLLRQDPRYFVLGEGSAAHRLRYAASRIFVTRGQTGARQFNVSEVAGTAVAAAASNLYYPHVDRSGSDVIARWGLQMMWDAAADELKEFWPTVRARLHRS
jgi:hypothetical protein